jgi:hypothetical protein
VALAVVFGLPGSSPVAKADVAPARIVQAGGPAQASGQWGASTLVQLDRPDGVYRLVKIWSNSTGEWADQGDQYTYRRSDAGTWVADGDVSGPLALLPSVSVERSDGKGMSVSVEDTGVAEGGNEGADQESDRVFTTMVSVGSGGANSVRMDGSIAQPGGEQALYSLLLHDPVEVEGQSVSVAVGTLDGQKMVYAQVEGTDLDALRAALDKLEIGADGAWSEKIDGLPDPASAARANDSILIDEQGELSLIDEQGELSEIEDVACVAITAAGEAVPDDLACDLPPQGLEKSDKTSP